MQEFEELSQKVYRCASSLDTEEATKTALVLPFIDLILHYNIFDPKEVVPEFTADCGIKKGEKIDYALLKDGKVQILMECKKFGEKLSSRHTNQLFRYFAATQSKLGILTNGSLYYFYADIETPNKMDQTPFLILDVLNLNRDSALEVKKMSKYSLDADSFLEYATELKYLKKVKEIIAQQFKEPTENFSRFFISEVFSGRQTTKIKTLFLEVTAKALKQFLGHQISESLKLTNIESKKAIENQNQSENNPKTNENNEEEKEDENRIVTTIEELNGFYIVKSILRVKIKASRIIYRDTINYFGIFLDHRRRQICQLHFNSKQKSIVFIEKGGKDRKVTRYPISDLDDIYDHSDLLLDIVSQYESRNNSSEEEEEIE